MAIAPPMSSKQFFVEPKGIGIAVVAWNGLGPELRSAKSISVFKKHILNIIRPVKKELFGIYNDNGIKFLKL